MYKGWISKAIRLLVNWVLRACKPLLSYEKISRSNIRGETPCYVRKVERWITPYSGPRDFFDRIKVVYTPTREKWKTIYFFPCTTLYFWKVYHHLPQGWNSSTQNKSQCFRLYPFIIGVYQDLLVCYCRQIVPRSTQSWFTATEIKLIYLLFPLKVELLLLRLS